MNNDKNLYLKRLFLIHLAFLLIALLYISKQLSSFLIPIFFSFFTAMFLYPFIKKFFHPKIPNWLSTIITYLIFIIIILTLITIVSISFSNMLKDLPEITKDFRQKIENLIISISELEIIKNLYKDEKFHDQLKNMFVDITKTIVSVENFNNYIIKPVLVTLDIFKGFGLYALSLIFIIPGMDLISDKILKAFPDKNGVKINKIILIIMDKIQNYIVRKSIISIIVGVLSFIICIIFGIKYAFLWGIIIFLFNFVPYIGSIIAVSFPMLISIIQYQSMFHFIFLSILLIIVQILMGNIIEPKFMSIGLNLSPIVILISLLVWGYIWGIAGVILAVPIMSAFNLICENIESLKPISAIISSRGKNKIFNYKVNN